MISSRSKRRAPLKSQAERPLTDSDLFSLRESLIGLPLIFFALARSLGHSITAYPHRTRADLWCFKLNRTALLTVDAAGLVTWKKVPIDQLGQIEALLSDARRVHEMMYLTEGSGASSLAPTKAMSV